jgi:diadenosine tetraphosphate (Ap4A) HIT family hydrolase
MTAAVDTADVDTCELCAQPGGDILWRNDKLRVVLVDDADYPGFCRVIWHAHVREMTDLAADERLQFMQAVWQVEAALRDVMRPLKINLASLGNVVPHQHWHVIPRYADDAHFPAPVWAARQRASDAHAIAARAALLPALRAAIVRALS